MLLVGRGSSALTGGDPLDPWDTWHCNGTLTPTAFPSRLNSCGSGLLAGSLPLPLPAHACRPLKAVFPAYFEWNALCTVFVRITASLSKWCFLIIAPLILPVTKKINKQSREGRRWGNLTEMRHICCKMSCRSVRSYWVTPSQTEERTVILSFVTKEEPTTDLRSLLVCGSVASTPILEPNSPERLELATMGT